MSNRIAFIHTSATLVPLFQELGSKYLEDVPSFHISDDSLIKDVIAAGSLTPKVARRVANLVHQAEDAGASHILVTCSSIGAAIDAAAFTTTVPVYRVDRPMAVKAVTEAERIGVIATLTTTLDPTIKLVEGEARNLERRVQIQSHLCEGAFEALMSGDSDTHDTRVREGLKSLMQKSDVIVLAQASMARVVETVPEAERTCPVLSSPELAVIHLAEEMG